MTKMLADGDDLLLWVPDGGIANIHAPTIAELTAGGVLNISCLVTKNNFALGANGNASISDPPLCSANDTTVPGRPTFQAGMDFYRYNTTLEDKAWATFTTFGIHGFLVHRVGKLSAVALAGGDPVRVFGALTGTPQVITPDANGGYRKFHLDFFVQGDEVDEHASVNGVAAAPVIASLAPSSVAAAGGAEVIATGVGFTGATAVTVAGSALAAGTWAVVEDTKLVFEAPAHAAGTATVTVTTPAGTSASVNLTYV